jgi:pantetheine-phosphate adenylyltransferase
MGTAVYPGSFDPITYGHLDLIKRGSAIFDELIVAVGENPAKSAVFSLDERVEMVKRHTKRIRNVRVDSFRGMLVDYVKKQGAHVILRGIRTVSDFEYEFQMALTNRALERGVETVFVMTSEECSYFRASLIREVASLGGSLRAFVPPDVEKCLKRKLAAQPRRHV